MAKKRVHLNSAQVDGSKTPRSRHAAADRPTFYNLLERVNQSLEREREANRTVRKRHHRCGEWTCLRPQCRPRKYEARHVMDGVAHDEDTPYWLMAA